MRFFSVYSSSIVVSDFCALAVKLIIPKATASVHRHNTILKSFFIFMVINDIFA